MNEQKSNKSLFLYTALIFLVALVMIIISFFGQSHLNETEKLKENATSLTQKASIISEENLILTGKISDLEESIEKKDEEIKSNADNAAKLQGQIDQLNALISANENYNIKDYDTAQQLISSVSPEMLSGDTLIFYNTLKSKIEDGKEEN